MLLQVRHSIACSYVILQSIHNLYDAIIDDASYMGCKKNASTHVSRGKFKKRRPPEKPSQVVPINPMPPLNGSRIIKLEHLQDHLQVITSHVASCHSSSSCSFSSEPVTVREERRDGLSSTLITHCHNCSEDFTLQTSSKVKGLTDKPHWEANVAAVWGQMSTGGGHSTLVETMAVLGVPVMNKRCFISTERRIGEWWCALLEESMKLAGQEERELAIARGTTCLGDPAITVILDGGWSKRTHKHSYNAKSGVAIIIGYETGKILFMGIRNKYCSVCALATNGKPPEHTCFKNWDGSSSAMETDIIVEGFKMCVQQHGVKYSKFIGDGDSSVRHALVSSIPWGFAIEKIECANHAVKCFRTHLETVVVDNPRYKGRGKLTEAMRKRLTKAARCAIAMRSKESDRSSAIAKLQKDLMNAPYHCFGGHSKCSTDFCKTAQKSKSTSSSFSKSIVSSVSVVSSLSSVSSVSVVSSLSCVSSVSVVSSLSSVSSVSVVSSLSSVSSPLSFVSSPSSISSPLSLVSSPSSVSTPSSLLSVSSLSSFSGCSSPSSGTNSPQTPSVPRPTAYSDRTPINNPTTSSTCSVPPPSNSVRDISPQDLCELTIEHEEHWVDATNDECLEEVRDIPAAKESVIDPAMICDIQRALSRLVGKAPELIGKVNRIQTIILQQLRIL